MANWNPSTGEWEVFAYPTDQKTDYSASDYVSALPDKSASDFASSYPDKNADSFASSYPYRSAADYASTYPDNRPTTATLWVKIKKGEAQDISWSAKSGDNWQEKNVTTSGVNDNLKQKLKAAGLYDSVKNKAAELSNNATANAAAAQQRQDAANEYNADQANKRQSAADTFNADQATNRQSAADEYNKNVVGERQKLADALNKANTDLKNRNESINNWSFKFATYASNVQSGTYLTSKDSIPSTELNSLVNSGLLTTQQANSFLDSAKAQFRSYYSAEKVGEEWDAETLGALDPTGKFDPEAYAEYNTTALANWNEAVRQDDLDIIGRYSQDTYLWQDYTSYGKFAGYRGSRPIPEEDTEAYKYKETLTDYEKQQYRDQVLGITTTPTGEERIVIATPEYDEEGNLINEEDVDTLLESTFAEKVSAADVQKEKQLGAMAQDLLKISIDELKKAKQKEANLSLMSGLPGYSEILNINSTLTNSIIGDSGIGGMLNLVGGGKEYEKQFKKDIEKITGVSSNSTVYNWQKWFDETLLKRYEDYKVESRIYGDEELKQLQEFAKEEIKSYNEGGLEAKPIYLEIVEKYPEEGRTLDVNNIEDFEKIMFRIDEEAKQEFVGTFIDGYIKPRFDQSKSMDEFISYLDVKENEQNVFQSQTVLNKLKQIADLRSKTFIDLIQSSEKAFENFNPEFYLDPLGQKTKTVSAKKLANYELQKQTIEQDFENAKQGIIGADDVDWAVEAYRYGYENTYKTDPLVFAKLHYQAKGSLGLAKDNEGNPVIFDPAEDILPYEELHQKIKNFGVEMAARRDFYGGAGFMKFVTPEEYADAVLASISPEENEEEWNKILKSIGLEGTDATIEQVKEYLIEQLRTEEAKKIRESIKYLNEQEEELNQETLGVSYIEREEDVKKIEGEQTALFTAFKNAGYGGSEDDFYDEFFPDIDRTEQEVIGKISSDKGLEFALGDMDNPFQAFTSVSSLFGEDETAGDAAFVEDEDEKEQLAASKSSYFKIFEDEEEELPEKSEAATSFLKDFTSMFKGFG